MQRPSPQRAILLLAHGSRDPAWSAPFVKLRDKVASRAPDAVVANAYLEHTSPDVIDAAREAVAAGAKRIEIVPIFLGPGGHVRSDLPRLAAAVRETFAGVEVTLAAPIGESEAVIDAIAAFCAAPEQLPARF